MENATATVTAIFIYPIKACKGLSVDSAAVCSTGFRWDRQWMVVNTKGRMMTQRTDPKLALVEVYLPPEALYQGWGSFPSDSALSLRAPGMEPLQIPLVPVENLNRLDNASVWDWEGAVLDEGADTAHWFSKYLGKECRLVRFDKENVVRPVDPSYGSGYKTAFADGFPFLLISKASLDDLNERLTSPLPINRFRPNIFVQGCEPFDEDFWNTFTISGLTFHGLKLCSRCKVTTVDQETGEFRDEPLKTLRSFRSGRLLSLSKKLQAEVYFGQNVVCEESTSLANGEQHLVRLGDKLFVWSRIQSIAALMG